ncbi:MAG TPA: hypothetical protein VNO52_10165 [Methylomirabilota bacterium]|nr:hypothetical protein [Methylomirabilota bacterium]
MLNALLPGAGLIHLGHRVAGTLLLSLSVTSAVGVLVLFFRAYSRYLELTLSGRVLTPGELERMGREFSPAWVATLLVSGVVAALISWVWLAIVRRQLERAGSTRIS